MTEYLTFNERPQEAHPLLQQRTSWFSSSQRRLRGGDGGMVALVCCGIFLFACVLLLVCLQGLPPTEYALRFNSLTGSVSYDHVYEGGRYFLGPGQKFITFPSYDVSLKFADQYGASSPPIDCRTGRDASDPDSGGQPVRIHLAFLYALEPAALPHIYQKFSIQYEARLLQFVRQSISDVAQKYNPAEFWTNRDGIADDMVDTMRHDVMKMAGINISSAQLLRVEFNDKFEESIEGIQLAVQRRTTNEYQQQVVYVDKQIDILKSETEAKCNVINSRAQATSTLLINKANAQGFNMTQSAKALAYKRLGAKLNFNNTELTHFIKIKSIKQHDSSSLVVGM